MGVAGIESHPGYTIAVSDECGEIATIESRGMVGWVVETALPSRVDDPMREQKRASGCGLERSFSPLRQDVARDDGNAR